MKRALHVRWLAGLALLVAPSASAQLSPGELSRFHQGLEGARNCRQCHQAGRGVAPPLCLGCHTALGERVAAGKGLHARPEYRACERCHVEHQGRGFDLVFWGEAGRAAFDHSLTGFQLRGRHARLSCEGCHRPQRVRDPGALSRGGVNLARTFLGLGTGCTSCHADPHAGRFAPRGCADCHGQEQWKPAAQFDHGQTRFPLTGRHQEVACEGCHARQRGALKLDGDPRQACATCHADPHAGRLGRRCAECHDPTGWKRVAQGRFDHDRTRFPLQGRHAGVACASCHRPGRSFAVAHARCADCHADRHAGQLGRRADGGRCESCHDVNGFTPARFGADDHARTSFPLTGAHLAVPCDGCHPEVPRSRLPVPDAARGPDPSARTERFRFASTRCGECHADPHRGQAAAGGACEGCHRTERWSTVTFDHARTAFPLAAAHAALSCRSCHPGEGGALAFRPRPTDCAGCHRDPHDGQFARDGRTDCTRCHAVTGWTPVRFDHRHTAFPLEGAHLRVPCAGCHRPQAGASGTAVRYSGVGKACADCHGAPGAVPRGGAR